MESSVENIKRWLFYLIWNVDDSKESNTEENEQVITRMIARRYNARKWLRSSRKSIVRMICTYLFSKGNVKKGRKIYINRSIVRMIGSKLPLTPSKRAYFEILCESKRDMMTKARTFVVDNINTVKMHMPEMGLADIGLFAWDGFDEEQSMSRSDIITRTSLENTCLGLSQAHDISMQDSAAAQTRNTKYSKKLPEKECSDEKISALENELANLRAQIALIVSTQEKPKAAEAFVPPAPPPPPPILLPPSQNTFNNSVKLSKKQKKEMCNEANTMKIPDMKDVLIGLSNIKLRSSNIKRSPGGTPLKVKSSIPNTMSSDPADIIGNALRKKFAKARRSIESPTSDKENQSPHGGFSPNSPCKSDFSPITSSPCRKGQKSMRRSSNSNTARAILSPVNEN